MMFLNESKDGRNRSIREQLYSLHEFMPVFTYFMCAVSITFPNYEIIFATFWFLFLYIFLYLNFFVHIDIVYECIVLCGIVEINLLTTYLHT